jgi:hypothetical protein
VFSLRHGLNCGALFRRARLYGVKLISCYVIDAENDVFAGISRPECKVNVIVSVAGKYLERAVFLL